ncbi:MAG: DUF1178 family protein [Pseudomonadota bacterium]
MIKYTLKCDQGHVFDSWFASGAAYDSLQAAGHVSCAVCGSTQVGKAMMAPQVSTIETEARQSAQKALKALKREVEQNSDYVGRDFASQARAMHLGDVPERSIWGEAKPAEAKALIEDGVPVLPLPFTPKSKTN